MVMFLLKRDGKLLNVQKIVRYFFIDYKVFNRVTKIRYDVHRFDIDMEKDQHKLTQFLNDLKGEVVSIIPNVKPTFKLMGATAQIDFLLIVEKIG
jgi:hypothetical protein